MICKFLQNFIFSGISSISKATKCTAVLEMMTKNHKNYFKRNKTLHIINQRLTSVCNENNLLPDITVQSKSAKRMTQNVHTPFLLASSSRRLMRFPISENIRPTSLSLNVNFLSSTSRYKLYKNRKNISVNGPHQGFSVFIGS